MALSDSNEPLEEPPALDPSAEELLSNAAQHAASSGESQRAIAIYRELLALNPADVTARTRLAVLLHSTGDGDSALEELEGCRKRAPDHPDVLITRGAILGMLGRYREAETDLRDAVDLEPFNAESHFNLGLLMSRRGLWGEALP
jgi:tetratricopeptide (TPR) repeat protein